MNLKTTIEKIDNIIIKINGFYLIFAIALMAILVFCNVIGRYFFSFTYIWVEELSRFLMISLAFLGVGLAMRQGSVAAFTIFQNVLPDKIRIIVRALVLLIVISFMVIFCYLGFQYAMRNMRNLTEALRWRAGLWYLMIPIGSLLFVWHTLIISKQYVTQNPHADIEREIAAGNETTKDSEYLKDNNEKAGGEESK